MPGTDAPEVTAALRRAGLTDVDDSRLARALYSSDASLYRVVPTVVARPRHIDEIDAILAVARACGTPVTMRGAGTSIAGNAVGAGIVVDTLRHLHHVLAVDPEARTATVEPGAVHATVQRAAAGRGLRFGPDPSTHSRCTVGGMVGNNACGSRALGYGRTSDNVVALDALTAEGRPVAAVAPRLAELVDAHLATVRTRMGRFGRQVSGYSLEHLLPEHGRSLDRFLVGSEGTLALVRRATVRLVPEPACRALVVLGHASMAEAADTVPGLLRHSLVACEGLDERVVGAVSGPGGGAIPPRLRDAARALPRGSAWLFAEVTGSSPREVAALAAAVAADSGALESRVLTEAAEQRALWRLREDGSGLAVRNPLPSGRRGLSGWEDAAVPPDLLGAYLRDFEALLSGHGLHGAPYGHFGEGCVHVRIDFDLGRGSGVAAYRRFVEEAADLTAAYGGSLSGEHGDGRARSELLPRMYAPEVLDLFAQVKRVFDPENLLNPGVLVDPAALDADLRLAGPRRSPATALRLVHDAGSLDSAVHRCTGVGRCLADGSATGQVMCPSYLATREEKDSTRGRARVLQEMVNGTLVEGWDAPEVEAALDLCLSCRGCARDCPTGVDMATYRAEWLHQRYRGRMRPRSHYALGRLPQLLARFPPRLVRAALGAAPGLARTAAGVDPRRSLPAPAARPAHTLLRSDEGPPDVVLWLDTFTDRFTPEAAIAAAALLRAAGQRVRVLGGDRCCGLTLLSTGQLDPARRALTAVVASLAREAPGGVPVVVLEPSCLAVLREDAPQLIGTLAAPLAAATTLAEYLRDLGWVPPDLSGIQVLAQPHCHQAAVLGWEPDRDLLGASGAIVTAVSGCCGLAGGFGMELGHYEISAAVFGHDLGPAVRAADPGTVLVADGFSCRTQLSDLAGAGSVHLAQLLHGHFDPVRATR